MISLEDYITASGKYPERLKHPEYTDVIRANAEHLLSLLNPFLEELGLTEVKVSSGFRPSDVNAELPNSAKKSLHMQGLAADLEDSDGKVDAMIEAADPQLKKYGLWQESPMSTKSWAHIDCKDRGKRPKNQFIP